VVETVAQAQPVVFAW